MNARPGGLAASLRGLAATGVSLVQTRLELLSVEFQEETQRLTALIVYSAAAFFFLGVGLAFLAVLITVLLWDTHRVLALSLASGLFLGIGAVWAILAAGIARSGSRLFAASLAELAQDREALKRTE